MWFRLWIVIGFPLGSSLIYAQTPFYQGKLVTIVVATKAGDVYDLYPRLLAEYLPKYIPGNPNVIIQNVARRRFACSVLRELPPLPSF